MAELPEELVRIARFIARQYFLPDGDEQDMEQEALIGAWKAVRDFKPEAGLNFVGFAAMCIRRQCITAVKTSTRQKHSMLNGALRSRVNDEGEVEAAAEWIPGRPTDDPLETLLRRERLAEMVTKISHLTEIQREATLRLAAGESYVDMADLGDEKRIDNALQRARVYLTGDTLREQSNPDLFTKKERLPWESIA